MYISARVYMYVYYIYIYVHEYTIFGVVAPCIVIFHDNLHCAPWTLAHVCLSTVPLAIVRNLCALCSTCAGARPQGSEGPLLTGGLLDCC